MSRYNIVTLAGAMAAALGMPVGINVRYRAKGALNSKRRATEPHNVQEDYNIRAVYKRQIRKSRNLVNVAKGGYHYARV